VVSLIELRAGIHASAAAMSRAAGSMKCHRRYFEQKPADRGFGSARICNHIWGHDANAFNGKVEKESLLWFKNALKNGDFSESGGSRERMTSIEALNSHF
jgi:hypothetical protein